VLRDFDNPRDIVIVIRDLEEPVTELLKINPSKLTTEEVTGVILVAMKTEEGKDYVKRSHTLQNNLPKLYGLMWGQCTPGLQSELQGDLSYKEKSKDYDCL